MLTRSQAVPARKPGMKKCEKTNVQRSGYLVDHKSNVGDRRGVLALQYEAALGFPQAVVIMSAQVSSA